MNRELLKELYFFELSRKQQLESSLVLPVAVLTGLGGVVFSFARAFRYAFNLRTYIFVVALLGATGSLLWVVYYLIRTTHRFSYELLPSSLELLSFYERTRDYYRSLGTQFRADEEFEAEMKRAYATANSKNRQNNISKAGFLYRAQMGLVSGALFLGISPVPYFADEITKPAPVRKIELVNTMEVRTQHAGK